MATIRKALNLKDLAKISGGNIFEDIYCFFEGHGYNSVGIAYSDDNSFKIVKYKCVSCGKTIYEKEFSDGNSVSSSKSEFDKY